MNLTLTQQHFDEAGQMHEPKKPVKAVRSTLKDGRNMVITVTLADGTKQQIRAERLTQCRYFWAGIFARQDSQWIDGQLKQEIRLRRLSAPNDTDMITRRKASIGDTASSEPLIVTCIPIEGEPWHDFFTDAEKARLKKLMPEIKADLLEGELIKLNDVKAGDVVRFRASGRYRLGVALRTTGKKILVGFMVPTGQKCKHAWILKDSAFDPKAVAHAF